LREANRGRKSPIRRHNIDRRAGRLADEIESRGEPDDIFNTVSVANVTEQSEKFFELGRARGYGPQFVKFGSLVGYRRDKLVFWLRERARDKFSPQNRRTKKTTKPALAATKLPNRIAKQRLDAKRPPSVERLYRFGSFFY
jgi:hypothetical protein